MSLELKYFVLKPKGSDAFAVAARKAIRAFSLAILNVDPQLSKELWEWMDREMTEAAKFVEDEKHG